MSFSNTEILPKLAGWFRPLIGRDPYNKKNVDDNAKAALQAIDVLEQHFLAHTFFVGDRTTLADIFVASLLARGFEFVLDKQWRDGNPNTTRWYETITNQPMWKAVVETPIMIEEAVKYTPPKKEAKQEKPKSEPAPKAEKKPKVKDVDDDEEEEEAKPDVKQKHPLEALPKPTLILDDWKRKYSNEDTRKVALPWFWEHYKPEEYSLWRVDYKYNDELTMTFMSSNLIGRSNQVIIRAATDHLQVASSLVSKPLASTYLERHLFMVLPMTL